MRATSPISDLFESAALLVMQRRPAVHHAATAGARLLAQRPEAPSSALLRDPPGVSGIGPPGLAPRPGLLSSTAAAVAPHRLPRGAAEEAADLAQQQSTVVQHSDPLVYRSPGKSRGCTPLMGILGPPAKCPVTRVTASLRALHGAGSNPKMTSWWQSQADERQPSALADHLRWLTPAVELIRPS